MATEALFSIAQEMIGDVIKQQFWQFACAENELKKVQRMLQSIQHLIADAERRVAEEKNVRHWLSKLRSVAYDIEDVAGDWLLEKDGNEDAGGNKRKRLCKYLFIPLDLFSHVSSRYKLGVNIKEIKERLDQIDEEKNQFNFSRISNSDGERRPSLRRSRTTTSHVNEEMIGREDDMKAVIRKLISSSSKEAQEVQVIAIVGIGGQGKTTLARRIYHNPQVQNYFQGNLYWVFVSDNFDLKRLTIEIIEEVNKKVSSVSGLNSLQKELMEALRGKRFLLVLDDVWNADESWWKTLLPCLASGASESRILVTTRPQKVAQKTMNATYIHRLEGLSLDNSWNLFKTIALEGRSEAEYSELESVGREIVRKCNGVPLSITVMASVMNSKNTKNDWENILDSKMWSLLEGENKILPALWLSYDNLPSHLRQCFVYCSIFPKNWQLKKEKLVKLWVAQGFIRPDGNRDLEDIGAEYFDDLVAWSIFQQVKVDYRGLIRCKMHDLLHDLAEFIADDEIYTNDRKRRKLEQGPSDSDARHAFLSFNSDDGNPNLPSHRARKLRTLFFDGVVKEADIVDVFHKAKLLRAVILSGSQIQRLPKDIGKLKQLRYLDLSATPLVELPESVTYLPNLHTLDLSSCRELKELPRGIGRMVSLRYLEIQSTCRLHCLPKGLGKISCLRSLCKFIVEGKGGCKIEELQRLNSLQGSLEIEHLERVSSREEAEKAQLWKKLHLRSLVLRMSVRRDDDDAENRRIHSVFEGLRPQKNLEELTVDGYRGRNLPDWMEGMPHLCSLLLQNCNLQRQFFSGGLPYLPNLKKFKIYGFGNEILPNGGWEQLKELQKLKIYICHKLKSLPDELMLLQSLEKLTIIYCDKLKSLPEGLGKLKKLKSLQISYCEKLTYLPDSIAQLELLEDFRISTCEKLKSLPHGLGQLKTLKSLKISSMKALTCMLDSGGEFHSLENLEISDCDRLESLPKRLLRKLKKLHISGSIVLTCLVDVLGQLESLENLTIVNCSELKLFPDSLGQLKMLKNLSIWNCSSLLSLPDSLVQLKTLNYLEIRFCPLLLERCKRGGEDWLKISHIPNIFIQFQRIQ